MVDLKNINDKIISNRWKERYAQLPDIIKEKLDNLVILFYHFFAKA